MLTGKEGRTLKKKRKRLLWTLWGVALALAVGALVCSGEGDETVSVSAAQPTGYIALTFDDGPWPQTTSALLDGLAERGVKATFFLIGSQVESRAQVVRRMADEGHQIGLHTWDHVELKGKSATEICAQLDQTRQALEAIVGPVDFMLRPPYGFVDDTLRACADTPIICWSVDTEDWKDKDPDRIVQTVLQEAEDGAIILMHDIYDTSVQAALTCVDELLARGYCLVTVEDLFALRGQEAQAGQVYYALP
jgi:peptidoglycan/xylan/chitin deacetylase (PgdA/CDA1 family)